MKERELDLIHQRNQIMKWLSSILFLLDVPFALLSGSQTIQTVFVVFIIPAAVLIASFFILTQFKRIAIFTMYYFTVVLTGFMTSLVISSHYMSNFIFFFFMVVLVSLYQNYKPILAAMIMNSASMIYLLYKYPGMEPKNFDIIDVILFVVCLVFISVVSMVVSVFGERLRKSAENNAENADNERQNSESMLKSMQESAKAVLEFTNSLNSSIKETNEINTTLTDSFDEMNKASQEQSRSIFDTTESIRQLDQNILIMNKNTEDMQKTSQETQEALQSGTKQMLVLDKNIEKVESIIENTVLTMEELNTSSGRIENITDVIADISNQTNLLSLNAAIEAARAGEHGRGFSIVADEVRKLAEESRVQASEIASIVSSLGIITDKAQQESLLGREAVKQSKEAMFEMTNAFQKIVENSNEFMRKAAEIAQKISDTTNISSEIVNQINSISAISEENSASLEAMLKIVQQQNEKFEHITRDASELESKTRDLNL
jgi:methyl-accepting chemotaxis protein